MRNPDASGLWVGAREGAQRQSPGPEKGLCSRGRGPGLPSSASGGGRGARGARSRATARPGPGALEPEEVEQEDDEKEAAAASSCLILPGSADPLAAAGWGWPRGAGPRSHCSCPCQRAAGEVCAQPSRLRAAPRGSPCPARGLGGRTSVRQRGGKERKRESESTQGCAPWGPGAPGDQQDPTHRAAAPCAARPAGRRAPETLAHVLSGDRGGRSCPTRCAPPVPAPPQTWPQSAAYQPPPRPRRWSAHPASRRAERTSGEGGRGWLRLGPCKGGAPQRRRTAGGKG